MDGEVVVRDVILRDGSTLRLRSASPEDFDDIQAFYEGLSEQSRYLRFHGFGRTDAAARDYAEADGDARVALIGRQAGRVVAAAGYDRLREPGAAEVAFTVADDFQGRGTATRLLEQLAGIAAGQGIGRFDAEVMSDNRAMLGVFKRAGFDLRREGSFGEVVVSLDIRPDENVEELIAGRDHRAAVASLRPILAPAAIAVVGASRRTGSVGHGVLANVLAGDFAGVVTPVSRSGGVVRSVRVVEALSALDAIPELVIIAVPADAVLAVAAEAAEMGARALVVLSEGFSETGEEGRLREEQLLELVRSAGMRLVGPNSLGIINTDPVVSLNATVAGASVPPGRLAICSQSGAIGLGLLGHAAARRLGISSFASLGNRADVSTNDLLEYWEEDERTAAVMLYVQTFGNPERFTRIARRVSQRKPILVVKGLRMETTRVKARSHTAAAQHGDAVVDALLRHAGVLRFRSGDELFNAAQFFESQPLPLGRRIGVVRNSYGVGTLAVDSCVTRGLAVPPLRPSTVERLDGGGPVTNPVTLGIYADAAEYAIAIEALLADEGVDAVVAFYVDLAGGDPSAVLEMINEVARGQDKPVVASVVTAEGRLPEAEPGGVPNFLFPEACAGVLARAAERREWLSRPLGARPRYGDLDPAGARERVGARDSADSGWLPTPEAQALLATHGIPFVTSETCAEVDAAVSAAEALGGPVVLKADFPPPGHAGDVDAVLLGLDGSAAIRAGWAELGRRVDAAGREWHGVVVQPLVAPGADVLVGAISDPELGTVMALGLGGRQAGLAGDVGFRLLPVTDVDADELLAASRSVAVQLDGFRGSPILDRDALRELILRFARFCARFPRSSKPTSTPCGRWRRGRSSSTRAWRSSTAGGLRRSRPGEGFYDRVQTTLEAGHMNVEETPRELWGGETRKAVANFPVSGERVPVSVVRWLARVKGAGALANAELGLLDGELAERIAAAAREIAEGLHDDQFPIDVFQTGSGTSTNMNANEVIANLAGEGVHPNDHVNMGQSSNDVFPSAVHLAALDEATHRLLPALEGLEAALAAKAEEFKDVVKAGRTHLMDAVPVTLGQEFAGYGAQIRLGARRVSGALPQVAQIPLGGTATGTGLNTHPQFAARVRERLQAETGLEARAPEDAFEAQACRDALIELSGALKVIAVSLTKIAGDIALMGSGPRAGIGELLLPELQKGSSIMPGKVNPVLPEVVMQVAAQVIGNDLAVTIGGMQGNFELNVRIPLLARNLLQSIHLLTTSSQLFTEKCVNGIEANLEGCERSAEGTLAVATALNPFIGYDRATEIVKDATASGRTLREVAREHDVDEETLDKALDLRRIAAGSKAEA